jgi:hypothetical protein
MIILPRNAPTLACLLACSHHITLPHHTTPHDVTSHYITSHYITPHHITPHHTTPHHTTPHDVTSHYFTTPHHTTPHHTTSPHHLTLHHITSPHLTPHVCMVWYGMVCMHHAQGTQVECNRSSSAVGTVSKHKKRVYRQYMNRRGGFNRPLQKMN